MIEPQVLPGTITSRYRVERELGRGGMSSVYLADDLKHGRKVAVKLTSRDHRYSTGPDRFSREIEVTAKFSHPHILPLLDSGEVDGCPFYVMPFIEGESLRQLLNRQKQLPLTEALQITREVADALAYAHGHNVVHRDIKPENVLLSAGHAVVADFGIAREIAPVAEQRLTVAGLAIGTLTYMSPEQSLGEAVDGRTDVYSLGCMLYEMLTGAAPFDAKSAVATLARKISEPMPDVSSLRGVVPDPVIALVVRALAREPDARYESAAAVMEAIDTVRAGGTLVSVPSAPRNSIAVLPFSGQSGNPEDEYLGDGISEELMHALTRLGGLRVIARTSAFAFRKSGFDLTEIGRRLNVSRIVEGSVRRAGNRIRVTATLVDASSAVELWSARFDRQMDDLFDIEDEIAASVARTLKQQLLEESGQHLPTTMPPHGAHTTSLVAYEHYLKGRHFWALRTDDGLQRSVEHLSRAIEVDLNFALAHAALADTYVTMGLYGSVAPATVMSLARDAAERAIALDGRLAEALTARACVRAIHDWDWAGAEEDFAHALRIDAQYPTAHQWYAMHCLVPLGRFDEARLALVRARELDPVSLSIAVSIAAVDYYGRRNTDAIISSRAVIALDERFAMGHYFLGLALEQEGRLEEAIASLEKAMHLVDSAEIITALGHARAAAGDTAGARALLATLEERMQHRYLSPVLLAKSATGLGDHAKALSSLRQAYAMRSADLIWLGVRPAFEPLHGDPEFHRLLDAVRLPLIARATHATTSRGESA